MKMLGNDVVTQEEFDQHISSNFNPLQEKADNLESKLQLTSKLIIALSAVCAALAASQILTVIMLLK